MSALVIDNLIFVTGGAKSGKTKFSEDLGLKFPGKRIYLATAGCLDSEMTKKIEAHKKSREGDWETIEEEEDLSKSLEFIDNTCDILLIDCITLWVSNLLLKGYDENNILKTVNKLILHIKNVAYKVIIISNELGMGVVPDNKLARSFRDIHGLANQIIAKNAGSVYFMVSGIGVKVK